MEGEAFPHLFPCEIKPTNEQIEGGEKCAPMIAGASRVHWEIKGEINKSRHGRVYMYNTGEQLLGSVRTQAESRILTIAQINKQIESRSSSSEKKGARWHCGRWSARMKRVKPPWWAYVRSSMRTHIYPLAHDKSLPQRKKKKKRKESVREAQLPFQEMQGVKIKDFNKIWFSQTLIQEC